MRSDPKLDHLIIDLHADRTVIEIDPDGIHRLDVVDLLESEARVLWILFESLIGSTSLCLNRWRKLSKGLLESEPSCGISQAFGVKGQRSSRTVLGFSLVAKLTECVLGAGKCLYPPMFLRQLL